jgi:hypothetical protein
MYLNVLEKRVARRRAGGREGGGVVCSQSIQQHGQCSRSSLQLRSRGLEQLAVEGEGLLAVARLAKLLSSLQDRGECQASQTFIQ